ncbi:MAG: S-layer homology domain-containing protein [Bacillota bacterium]
MYRGMVPKAVYILLAVIFIISAAPNPTYAEQQSFKDVDELQSSWPYVRYLVNAGAATGYPDGTFRPQEGTTRAQVAKIITLLAGWPLEKPEVPTFRDVPSNHWAYPYVETAVKRGILKGYSNKTFLPNRLINKAELAVTSLRFTGKEPEPTIPRFFNDVTTDHWAYPAIAAAVDAGMLNWADGKVEPDAPATRARTAKALAVASLIMSWEEETVLIARLHVNEGTATIYKKGSEKGQELTPDQKDYLVEPGDKISTGSQGTVRITFEDGSALELAPDTTIEIIKGVGLRTIRWDGTPISSVDDLRLKLVEGVIFGGLAPRYEVVPDASQPTETDAGNPEDQPVEQPAQQSNNTKSSLKGPLVAVNQGLTIVADTSTVYADGKTKVVLTVKLVDAEGNTTKAPKEGVAVKLSASAGELSNTQIKIPSGGSEGKTTWTAPGTMPQGKAATIEASGKNILGNLVIKIMEPPWWRQSQSKKVRVTVDMPWGVAGVRGSFFKVKVVQGEQHVDIIVGEGFLEANNQVVNLTQGTQAKIEDPNTPPTDAQPITVEALLEWQKVLQFVEATLQNIVQNAAADTIPRGVDTPPVTVDKLDNYIPATLPGTNTGDETGGQGTGTQGTGTQGTGSQGTGAENTGTTSTNLYSQILITIQDEQAKLNKLLESMLAAQKDSTNSANTDQGPPPDTEPPTVTVKPAGGSYRNVQYVELAVSEQPASIYFTTNGSIPTADSSVYTNKINIGSPGTYSTTPLKFRAVDAEGNWSQTYTEIYKIDMVNPEVQADPDGGYYDTGQTVTLVVYDNVTTSVYYTTDGTDPALNGITYTQPIEISSSTTLKVMAVDSVGNQTYFSRDYVIKPLSLAVTVADPRRDLPSPSARVAVMKYDEGNGYYTQVASGFTNDDGIINFSTAPLQLGENYLVVASNSAGNFLYYRDFIYSGIAGLIIKKKSSTRTINFSSLKEDGISPLAGTLYASLYIPHGETNAIAYSYTLAYMNTGQSEVWLDPGNYYFQVGGTQSAYYIRGRETVTNETYAVQLRTQNMVPVTMAVYGGAVGNYYQSWLNPRNPEAWITPNISNSSNGLYHLSAGSYSLYAWLGNYMGRYEVGPNNAPLQPYSSMNWQVGGDLTGYLSSNGQYFVPGNAVLFYPGIVDAYGNAVTDILGSNLERVNATVTITISRENYQDVVTKTDYWKNFYESEGLNWIIPAGAATGTYTASIEINGQSAGTFHGTMNFTIAAGS